MPSNPLYTSESSAPQTHLFSATINLTSTVTQFIFTTTSNAGMAAIKDIVSSAIAATGATCPTVTPAPPDTAVSPPAQVSIVSIDQRNASVGSFAPTTTIINNVETPSNQASRLPSSPTSSQTEDADATVASAAAADEAVASGQPDDWEGEQNRTAAAWDLFKAHPKEIDLYPDPREFPAHAISMEYVKNLKGFGLLTGWRALKKILPLTQPLGTKAPRKRSEQRAKLVTFYLNVNEYLDAETRKEDEKAEKEAAVAAARKIEPRMTLNEWARLLCIQPEISYQDLRGR